MIKLRKTNFHKIASAQNSRLMKQFASLGTATVLLLSLTGCNKEEKKDKILKAKTGKLYLVDVLEDEKKLVLKDFEGNEIKYDFTEDTVAIVGSEDGVTKKGKEYEVMLVDNDGNITYGYMDGKFLSDTYLDCVNVKNSEFTTYYVSPKDGTTLDHNIETQNNRKISTLLDLNFQLIGSVNNESEYALSEALIVLNNKFIYGFIDSNDLSQAAIILDSITDPIVDNEGIEDNDDQNNVEPEIIEDEVYVVNTNGLLNVRSEANTSSECIDKLSYGTEVSLVNGVDPKNDSEIKWVYISFKSTTTGELNYGWIAAEVFSPHKEYIVKKSLFINKNFSIIDGFNYDDIMAPSAIVFNASTGRIFLSKDMTGERAPASITKILTAYIVYKYGNLDDYIEYSSRAVNVDGHKYEGYGVLKSYPFLNDIVKVDNKISVKDALHISLMLSDNATTIALEEYVMSITNSSNFADLMNKEAQILECKKTYFTNSFGYEDANHVTCSLDMAKIMRAILNESEEITEILGKKEYVLESCTKQDGSEVKLKHTIDMLIDTNPNYNQYAIASKSGFHNLARWTLVTAYEKDGIKYVVVTMGNSSKASAIKDSLFLAECFGFGANEMSLDEVDNKVLGLH